MRPVKTCNLHLGVAAALIAGGLAACAPPATAPTGTTAADIAPPSPAESPPATRSEAVEEEAPASRLVCRTTSRVDGTSELYLEWNGTVAKGSLRTVAPSGMVYVQRVQAERSSGTIVADDARETDL